MANNGHFAKTPNINIPRTKMKMSNNLCTTFNHGQLIPIDCFEIIPGDTFSLNLSSLVRMSTPIFPIMDNIDMYIHAFFVPMRLVWKYTEEFYGANKTDSGYQTTEFKIPCEYGYNDYGITISHISKPTSLPSYLGYKFNEDLESRSLPQSVLPSRAYWLIWSDWYRAQQLQDPFILSSTDDKNIIFDEDTYMHGVGTIGDRLLGCFIDGSTDDVIPPAIVCKKFDYFTAATLAPQYGASVTLPLGTYAPVVALNTLDEGGSLTPAMDTSVRVAGTLSPAAPEQNLELWNSEGSVKAGNIKVDLSEATAATINSIRYAFAVQKYLERSNFGSRFFEMLAVHYGVTSPDARLQRPEYLGGTTFRININQVLATANTGTGSTSKVGNTGAVSVTANKSHIFTKGFVEPGYVMIMASTKHDQTYSQGIEKYLFKRDRFEFWANEFAYTGDEAIYNKEIYVDGTADDDKVFGYQEKGAEYRYRPDRVTGLANPNATGALDYLNLANRFTSRPSLSETFILENRESLQDCLTTGSTGPDYICDFYFDYTAVREVPAYSIPGLVDHFGVM